MTKRNSVCAGIDSPRVPTSMQRHQFAIQFQARSGASSSEDASSSATAMGTWPQDLNHPHGSDPSGTTSSAHHFGYTSEIPPVPLPPGSPSYPQGEAYPLQSGNPTTASSASHSHFQGGRGNSPVGSSKPPYGDGGRSLGRRTEPPAGIFLQWNCWSC